LNARNIFRARKPPVGHHVSGVKTFSRIKSPRRAILVLSFSTDPFEFSLARCLAVTGKMGSSSLGVSCVTVSFLISSFSSLTKDKIQSLLIWGGSFNTCFLFSGAGSRDDGSMLVISMGFSTSVWYARCISEVNSSGIQENVGEVTACALSISRSGGFRRRSLLRTMRGGFESSLCGFSMIGSMSYSNSHSELVSEASSGACCDVSSGVGRVWSGGLTCSSYISSTYAWANWMWPDGWFLRT
jgi:hypothetical protein